MTQRMYAAEGGVHLYSSLPTVLCPADLYRSGADSDLQQAAVDCNIYLIARRRRIYIDPENFSLDRDVLLGSFVVKRQNGFEYIPFKFKITPERAGSHDPIEEVAVALSGTHIVVISAHRENLVPALVIIAEAESALEDEDCDLEVLYVGQGIGKSVKRTALDRLLRHSTLQRILADTITYMPNCEILLLLYRFEHEKILISNGGDFNLDPRANHEDEHVHMERMRLVSLDRRSTVSLAEAGLINHFKPHYNTQLKGSDFAARNKITVLRKLLSQDIAGLMVEICTANIRSRLWSQHKRPREMSELFEAPVLNGEYLDSDSLRLKWAQQLKMMAHTHHAQFPLTYPHERDTFLHGMIWKGETDRSSLW